MTETTITPPEANTGNQIEEWLAEATPEAAERLDALARTTDSKDERKAARRALYLLSQRGITPPSEPVVAQPDRAPERRAETLRAWASAYDGAGNRLLLLALSAPDGGDATVAQILANDELGVRNLTQERRRLREIAPLMERLEGRIDDGLVVAEIEPDYARQIIEQFRRVNLQRRKATPAGFVDLLPRIGSAERTVHESPVYEALSADDATDASVPGDPVDLFKLTWFEPWFFAVEEVTPWLAAWIDAESSVIVTSEKVRQERKQSIAKEAAVALITDHARALYVTRLEESADVLRRRGRMIEARQSLLHAQAMKSDTPIAEVPFAEALAARTLDAAAEMVAASRREQAGKASPASE